eukprot:jgi/Botrbrau1/20047/Bobra.200_1s0052.1
MGEESRGGRGSSHESPPPPFLLLFPNFLCAHECSCVHCLVRVFTSYKVRGPTPTPRPEFCTAAWVQGFGVSKLI